MVMIGKRIVIESQLMQDGGEQVRDAYGVLCGAVADVIGSAMDVAWPESADGQKCRERVAIVISSQTVLRDRQTSEFARPEYDRVFQ